MDLLHFRDLIAERLGLQLRSRDDDRLQTTVTERCAELNLADLDAYWLLLREGNEQSAREWRELTTLLTTGETYFFRGGGQIGLLTSKILPELIKLRRHERCLNIWSAGCSSGEEPYSLAMLIEQLLPDRARWNINILATDIDAAALEKARRGVYTEWSFRKVKPDVRRTFFRQLKQDWEIAPGIKQMVNFDTVNLLTDAFPNTRVRDMDLIVCRNVFIYFDPGDVQAAADKFGATLRDGGFLMTGHGELRGRVPNLLHAEVFPESVVYRQTGGIRKQEAPAFEPLGSSPRKSPREQPRSSGPPATTMRDRQPKVMATTASEEDDSIDELLAHTQRLLDDGAHVDAVAEAERVVDRFPELGRGHYLLAQAHANLGHHEKAIEFCRRAIDIDSFAVEPHYLMAHIAQDNNRFDDAKRFLKKVLYLSPSHVAAHLELADMYERDDKVGQARQLRLTALRLLEAMPRDSFVNFHEPITAGELLQHVEKALR